MGKPRKTGNELFDIVWAEYPPRNGRKETKAESLVYWKKKKFSEEQAYDMVEWIKKDKESRAELRKQNKFCSEPKDFIRFLKKEVWEDEIGVEVTDSQRYEKKRSVSIQSNNAKNAIELWSNVIDERSVEELINDPRFRAAGRHPEFKAWAKGRKPGLVGAVPSKKPAPPPEPVAEVVAVTLPKIPPPPSKQSKRVKLYHDVLKLKAEKFPLL